MHAEDTRNAGTVRRDDRHLVSAATTARRASLPGERCADLRLVDRAVAELNRMHRESALRLACQTGKYLLATFFGDDLAVFRERSGTHQSFRELAARADLRFSASFLYTSVAVVEQCRQLPASVAGELPLSHHRLLLPIQNRQLKTKLAQRAVRERLSKRALAEEVKALRRHPGPGNVKRGRPPLPEAVKKLHQLRRAAGALLHMKASVLDFEDYSPRAARELITELMTELEEVSEVLARLQEKARARPARTAAGQTMHRSAQA
jgi:hypothetical protein